MPTPNDALDRIPAVLEELARRMHNQKLLTRMAFRGEKGIQSRTRKGVGVAGNPFEPYNPAYAAFRREETGLATHPVTLTFDDISGMMRRIDHEVASNLESVTIDITDAKKRRIGSYHDSQGVGKRCAHIRHFWGLSDDDRKAIAEIAEDHLNAELADLCQKHSTN